MFPNRNQDVFIPYPICVSSQPLAIYPPQTYLFNQKPLNPYFAQFSRQCNQLNLNTFTKNNPPNLSNSLEYSKRKEIIDFKNHEKNLPLTLPQNEVIKVLKRFNGFLKLPNKSINTNNNTINKKKNNSNSISFDLSNINILPAQEKLSLEELVGPKRKNERWTVEEDNLLRELKKNHQLCWRKIASQFPARTLKACQFRISKLKNIEKIKNIKDKTSNLNI